MALVAAIGNAAIPDAGHAQAVPTQPTFTKQAFDPTTGLPLAGPVSVGQTIEYVLSYKPGTSPTGPVTIDDTLSPNLAYVNPSIKAPPNWIWNPSTPYSVGNHTQYSNPGFGPGTSFIVNVPVSQLGTIGPSGGDGTLPIPVVNTNGSFVYGLQHHLNAGQATIMCWNLLSLTPCPGFSPTPRSIGPDLMTPTLLRHAVVGNRIYFPSARVQSSPATTTPGIGCWDTGTDTACPFIPLPGGPVWPGPPPLASTLFNYLVAGIAAHPTLPWLFM